jgi:hypothetical protein
MVKHYVQYHNVEAMGQDCLAGSGYGIVTSKNWPRIIGHRVWLVRGKDNPRKYHLAETFIVQRFCATVDDGRFSYYAESDDGRKGQKKFRPIIEIGGEDWFPALFKAAGRFGLGLQCITNRTVITGLQDVSGVKD